MFQPKLLHNLAQTPSPSNSWGPGRDSWLASCPVPRGAALLQAPRQGVGCPCFCSKAERVLEIPQELRASPEAESSAESLASGCL